MNVIHKFLEFWPAFLDKKENKPCTVSKCMCTTLMQTLLRKIEQIREILLIS